MSRKIPGPRALWLIAPVVHHRYWRINGLRRAVEQFNAKIVLIFASYLKVDGHQTRYFQLMALYFGI